MQVSVNDASAHVSHIVDKWAGSETGSEEEEEAEGFSAAAAPRPGSGFLAERRAHSTRHRACSLAPGASFFSGVVIRWVFGSAMRRDRPKQPARLMYSQNKSSCSLIQRRGSWCQDSSFRLFCGGCGIPHLGL